MSRLPKITVISVSKPSGAWAGLVDDYCTRLSRVTDFKHIVIKERGDSPVSTRKQTTDEIRKKIPAGHAVVMLDERGKQVTSPFFAQQTAKSQKPVCYVIGSSYGVDEEFLQQADLVLGLSKMVLPHELARVMLLEQLYRAHAILTNHPYHHD